MNFFDGLMSPLTKEHCMYFYFLGYIALALAVISLLIGIMGIYKNNYKIFGFAMSYFLTLALTYYISRLQYSICLGAYK
jgi:hypothetical protein